MNFNLGYIDETQEVATNKKQQITNFIEHAWFF